MSAARGGGRTGALPAKRVRHRRGAILPAALLLLLAGTLMAASVLVMARSAALLADGDRHLARALSVRSALTSEEGFRDREVLEAAADGSGGDGSAGEVSGEEGSFPSLRELGGGYILLGLPAPGVRWSVWEMGWYLDPAAVADDLRAVADVGRREGEVDGELEAGGPEEGCFDPTPLERWWVRASSTFPPPDPPLAAEPRLGPIGIEELVAVADVAAELGRVGPGSEDWEASGLMVADGDLELGGLQEFTGLVLVAGDLVLRGGARVNGAVRVGRELRMEPETRIVGCRQFVREALVDSATRSRIFPVPGGAFLGRF